MKLLFLRGQVPGDRPKTQIMFDQLVLCDDMWSQLAYQLVQQAGGYGELWYEKGKRVARYADDFVERWVPRYRETKCSFKPDVVFARGGFPYMKIEAERHKSAFKIHYGAGVRVVPKPKQGWDLVLVDTMKQRTAARARGYKAEMFIKPAADNVFVPVDVPKQYDVIYCANWNANANKGHRFLIPQMKEMGLKVLHVGLNRVGWSVKHSNMTFTGWVPRGAIPGKYALAKVAVIRTLGKDSCPRVVPEALACDCPIVVGDSTKLWFEKYITSQTGLLFSKTNFQERLALALQRWESFKPRDYYDEYLSLRVAAQHVLKFVT